MYLGVVDTVQDQYGHPAPETMPINLVLITDGGLGKKGLVETRMKIQNVSFAGNGQLSLSGLLPYLDEKYSNAELDAFFPLPFHGKFFCVCLKSPNDPDTERVSQ